MATSNTMSNKPVLQRIIQGFYLVWLDENINKDTDDCRNAIIQLRQVINVVNTFTDIDECIDFIADRPEETAFMLVSEKSSRMLIPIVQVIPQIQSICILSQNNTSTQKFNDSCLKVIGVFSDIGSVCQALQKASKYHDHNAISLSFVKSTSKDSNANKNTLDCSVMYTRILKDILLTIPFDHEHITQFVNYCREIDVGNNVKLERFEKEYRFDQVLWWYTSETFVYSTLNRALRLMDIDIIWKMAFFLCDLHNQITLLHSKQFGAPTKAKSFVVYRGQGLSQTDFVQLQNNIGGLLSFNNFLSTSFDLAAPQAFAESNTIDPNLVGVLFRITVSPSMNTTPFADIETVSQYNEEEEILFSMHAVFRIGQINKLAGETSIWEVELTLTSDDDAELRALTEQIQKEIEGLSGWQCGS